MKLTPRFMAIVVFVVLFGGIMLSAALGQWVTTTTKEPMTFKEGEFAGQYNPADIRGSYTFGDISRLFGIPLEDLAFAFRLTEGDPALVRLGTLEDKLADMGVDLGTSSVRLFTALYAGLPFDLSLQDSYLLPEAVAILKEKANLTAEQSAYLDTHTADEAALVPAPQAGITDAAPTPGLRPQGSGGGSGIPIAGYTPKPTAWWVRRPSKTCWIGVSGRKTLRTSSVRTCHWRASSSKIGLHPRAYLSRRSKRSCRLSQTRLSKEIGNSTS